ncbi:MAG: hypothetical protein OK422_05585 [Thaumarchaeota archaeon]|nr:hypothetical protein [Nitrososphaerota archaeon]
MSRKRRVTIPFLAEAAGVEVDTVRRNVKLLREVLPLLQESP